MSTRKTTVFYAVLIAVASLAVGMVIASRLDLSPESSAQTARGAGGEQRADRGAGGCADVPDHRESGVARRRQHPHRVAPARAGADRVLRWRWRRRSVPPLLRPAARTRQSRRCPTTVAAGTGFIIGKEGLILTNNHVVEGADKVEVSLYGDDDDLRYKARVVGRDPLTDSALIELTEKPDHSLPEVKFGDSSQMRARRLGDGDRQPVQPVAHGQRRRDQRHEAAVSSVHRPLARHAADRCRDQSRELRRPAPERPRRSRRHEHGDLFRCPAVRQHRHRLRRADQHRPQPAAAAARRARSRAG